MAAFPYEHGPRLRRWARRNLERFERRAIEVGEARHAAVAVTLLPNRKGDACFLLTRRAAKLNRHGGQFALPGGRLDRGESVEEGALRELAEEVGLELEQDTVLGLLDDFRTRSGFVITPVVTWCERNPRLRRDPGEVARMFRVPIADLDRDDVPILTEIPESDRPVLSMPILQYRVHAPTAALIYQLLEVVLRGQPTRVAHYEQPVFAWR